MTWRRGEKEERMFASHLQWWRTDSHQTPAEWQSPSLSQVANASLPVFFFFLSVGVVVGGSASVTRKRP